MTAVDAVDTAALRRLAEELARAAGELALEGRRGHGTGAPVGHDTKSSATDPVTEFDRAAERLLVERIRELRPDDAIIGEEGAAQPGTSGVVWQLDPIDGTVNFLYDLPSWCTSVGVEHESGVRLAAAVHVPPTDELYSAAVGRGATRNGVALSVSAPDSLGAALVATGFSYRRDRRARQAERLARLLPSVRDVRRSGSAAVDLCRVAGGRVDAYFEDHLNSWDVSAGLLIAAEAGASTSDLHGGPPTSSEVLVCSPGIHDDLLAALAAPGADST
jgi:myo-inositol-1(or 4)-monophosphatase